MHHIKDPTQKRSPEWGSDASDCFCSDMLEHCETVWEVFMLDFCPVVLLKNLSEIQSHPFNTKMIN